MAIKVKGITVIDDNANLNTGATGVITALGGIQGIGIHSAGTPIYTGVITALNFVGAGNTFAVNGTTVDISIAGGGGGGGSGDGADYNTGITSTKYASASDDIDGYSGIAYSFASTVGKTYVVESIHVSNVSVGDLYFSGRIDFNSGQNVPLANKVFVPEQGAFELLDESIIANPSDNIRFGAFTGIGTTASGIANGLDCFITYAEKEDTDYIGLGTVMSTTFADQTVFTSTSFPSIVNTITLVNDSDVSDIDASVSIFKNGTIRQGYLIYNLTIPQNSTVQILPRPKHLDVNDTVVVKSSSNELGVLLAGKYIT